MDIDVHPRDDFLTPEVIIPVQDILCHCARMDAIVEGDEVWLSIGLERVSTSPYISFLIS
jgi:hypothetical protein